jgi:2-C-methyl-D-erythritol 4-phosphate cytidylyltransferase
MITALIVAAGQGRRMGGDRRKQYLELAGRPIVVHCLETFASVTCIDTIIMAVPADEIDFCRNQILPLVKSSKEMILVAGGERRQDSVYNGLRAIEDAEGIVLIHDGARPLVTARLIEACIDGARQWRACVPGLVPVDTLKRIDAHDVIAETIPRESLRMVQTPQAFKVGLIRKAHEQARQLGRQATDDATLLEFCGEPVHVIPGEITNLKITTPEDLVLAEACLNSI